MKTYAINEKQLKWLHNDAADQGFLCAIDGVRRILAKKTSLCGGQLTMPEIEQELKHLESSLPDRGPMPESEEG